MLIYGEGEEILLFGRCGQDREGEGEVREYLFDAVLQENCSCFQLKISGFEEVSFDKRDPTFVFY